ncbi:hypothetical protein LNV23_14625 [Paucibacter sp. DJ1R-11]|uniref:hypothetical protein n=1 Tax=Paucibacter sp. DJ1R-11 TaxID=2893556 RepID=UPI0021E3FFB3|nr:hypothetical protein [Paucibacter sp. DJ1R-11]MCV2364685.1 hypothetical protein [Paucibacter sp. DJ1R-11]
MEMMDSSVSAWNAMRAELRGNVRLRMGLLLLLAILGLWLNLLALDQAKAWSAEAEEARLQLERLRPLRGSTQWPQRAEEARKHLEAAKALQWPASSRGAAEAALQDHLRVLAEKTGLMVRDLSIGLGSSADALKDAQTLQLRAHLVLDGSKQSTMTLLGELAASPRVLAVETLKLRPQGQNMRAELDLGVLVRIEERRP